MTATSVLIFIGIGGAFIYDRYFSPKGQIKRLWDRALKLSPLIHKLNDTRDGVIPSGGGDSLKRESDRIGALINALIDYHFPVPRNEEDEEFVDGHRYQPFFNKDGYEVASRI